METNTNSNFATVFNILFVADLPVEVATLIKTKLEDEYHIRIGSFSQVNSPKNVDQRVADKTYDIVICNEEFKTNKNKRDDETVTDPKKDTVQIGQGTVKRWEESNPNIRIVLLVDDSKRSGKKLQSLYEYGFYNSFYLSDLDAAFDEFAKLIMRGRSKGEAYYYYGMDEIGYPKPKELETDAPGENLGDAPEEAAEKTPVPTESIQPEVKEVWEPEKPDMREKEPVNVPHEPVMGEVPHPESESMGAQAYGMPNPQMFGYPPMYGYQQGMPLQGAIPNPQPDEPGEPKEAEPIKAAVTETPVKEDSCKDTVREDAESVAETDHMGKEPSVYQESLDRSMEDIYKNIQGAFAESADAAEESSKEDREDDIMNQSAKHMVVEPSIITNHSAVAEVMTNYEESVTPQEGYVVSAVSDTVLIIEIPGAKFLSRKDEIRRMPINLITPRM